MGTSQELSDWLWVASLKRSYWLPVNGSTDLAIPKQDMPYYIHFIEEEQWSD